jgi:hypothetical protein
MKPLEIKAGNLCVKSTENASLVINRIGDPTITETLSSPIIANGKACYAVTASLLSLPAGRYIGRIGECNDCIQLVIPKKC